MKEFSKAPHTYEKGLFFIIMKIFVVYALDVYSMRS